MSMLNISGYKFIQLNDLLSLRERYWQLCAHLELKGTILLSPEGINLSLVGVKDNVQLFKQSLKEDLRFNDLTYRESYSAVKPFKRLKVKIKKEIISFKKSNVNPLQQRAKEIQPTELKQWLDEKRDFVLLDTRNEYEITLGTFAGAQHLHLENFSDFPSKAKDLPRDKPIVMFCTGGIRCEKAALHLSNEGHEDVYQLQGGILHYFTQVGGEHYVGECYVFDERVAVDAKLNEQDTP